MTSIKSEEVTSQFDSVKQHHKKGSEPLDGKPQILIYFKVFENQMRCTGTLRYVMLANFGFILAHPQSVHPMLSKLYLEEHMQGPSQNETGNRLDTDPYEGQKLCVCDDTDNERWPGYWQMSHSWISQIFRHQFQHCQEEEILFLLQQCKNREEPLEFLPEKV